MGQENPHPNKFFTVAICTFPCAASACDSNPNCLPLPANASPSARGIEGFAWGVDRRHILNARRHAILMKMQFAALAGDLVQRLLQLLTVAALPAGGELADLIFTTGFRLRGQ